jgi:hypothetical protein
LKIIVLVLIAFLSLNAAMKRDKKRDLVYDNVTKLMWQDSEENILTMLSQPDAIKYCENLEHAGYTNWRIPTTDEYMTIVDKTNKPDNINKAFLYTINDGYWSDKVHWRTFWFYADYMHFLSGTVYYDNKNKLKHIRCVRSLQ